MSGDLGAAAELMTGASSVDAAAASSLDGAVQPLSYGGPGRSSHCIRRLLVQALDNDGPARPSPPAGAPTVDEEPAVQAAFQLLFFLCLLEGRQA